MRSDIQIIFLMVLLCLRTGLAQVTYELHLGDLYKMQKGIAWPDSLNVVVGHEALLKLTSSFENQQACQVRTPTGLEFDVRSPPNNRFEVWGVGCGVRVKNVVPTDNGRWRLTSVRGNDSNTGWTEVHVEENIDYYANADAITLQDGQTHTTVELTTLTNSYCLVAQPFSESSLVPGHCSVTLDRTTRAVQGNWHVLLGLPGRVSELPLDRSVAVEAERLDIGFLQESSPHKLHIYCNIQHTAKNITFCRFQKATERAGFNIMDGLSDGAYSYYGDGFAKRHCGITIESPTANDYGTWRCTVGVQEWAGTVIEQRTPLQALIRVVNTATRSERIIKNYEDTESERAIFVQKDMTFSISCRADSSLTYCWFQHPNGTQFTPVEKVDDDQPFWYTGESLQIGDCGITFNKATDNESGLWTCHMGPRGQMGVEITDNVEVRVTGPLAARDKELGAYVGGNATLYCHSSNGNRPLGYCRFLSPQSIGINVDSTVTEDNAILGRFYFTPGRDLNYGDCSLNIRAVLEEDVGEWTCAGLVDGETLEAKDTIVIYIEAPPPTFRAGVIGMTVGASVLIVVLIGGLAYQYRTKISYLPWRRRNTQQTDDIPMQTRQDSGQGRLSMESDSSGGSNIGRSA